MTSEFTKDLIIATLSTYSFYVVTILTAVIAVGVAYLVYLWGKDQSFKVFGIYTHRVPWKGYKRFHSYDWNKKHTT